MQSYFAVIEFVGKHYAYTYIQVCIEYTCICVVYQTLFRNFINSYKYQWICTFSHKFNYCITLLCADALKYANIYFETWLVAFVRFVQALNCREFFHDD